jgi:hypothetical protein
VRLACSGEPDIPVGARVYAGLDLGATRDLSALVIVWQDNAGVFHVKPYCWLPGNLQERSEQDRAPYSAWEKLGFITPIGPSTDPRAIAQKIAELNGQNHIMSLAFDRWRPRVQGYVAGGRYYRATGRPKEVTSRGAPGPAVVCRQRGSHPRSGRWTQVRQGEKLWSD